MSFTRFLALAILSLSVAVTTSACSWIDTGKESSISEFYRPDAADDSKIGQTAKNGMEDELVNVDLNSDELNFDENKIGDWEKDLANKQGANDEGDFGGFGTRIPGVEFESVYFLFDQNNIITTEEWKLVKVADYLNGNAKAGVVIEGNCDERGTSEYNRSLGEKRAIAAKKFLMNKGIAENRIKTISNGEERPAVTGTTEEVFKLNRRDDFIPVNLLQK